MTHNQPDHPWYAGNDPWTLTQISWDPEQNIYFESIFTQANGYLGIRGYTEEKNEGVPSFREGYLGGVFGETDDAALKLTRVTYEWPMLAMITLPELFGCEIELNGEIFQLTAGTFESYRRSLHLSSGELVRELLWTSPSGKRTRLVFKRFLSAAVPHLGMQEIRLTALNWAGPAQLRFTLDGTIPTMFRTGDRTQPHLPQDLLQDHRIEQHSERAATMSFRTRGTDHLVAVSSVLEGGSSTTEQSRPEVLTQRTLLSLQKDSPVWIQHTVAVVNSRDQIHDSPIPAAAAAIAQDHAQLGYQAGLDASQAIWNQRWDRSDIVLEGPQRDQLRIRYAVFQTLQVGPFHTDNLSIPARGLSYNRYHGLYYWDSETFILPQFLYTQPQVARNLLRFRSRTLPGARKNARYLGTDGACYPWMTDADDGREQAPWHLGDYLWHQNASIAYAADQYVRAAGDLEFMKHWGLEMIVESARFWMSKLEEGQDGLVHLEPTVGPDELDQPGRDNGYVSLLTRKHLRLAASWAKQIRKDSPAEAKELFNKLALEEEEIRAWSSTASRIHIPFIPGLEVPLQDEFLLEKKPLDFSKLTVDEAFARRNTHRVVKQADIVLAMLLLQDEFSREQMTAAYDFYEPITVHFSSLSYCSHSILAAIIGRPKDAYEYFQKGAGLDLDNLGEGPGDGLHSAALAGTWQMVVYGFLGMRLTEEGLHLEPHLPGKWKSLNLSIIYRGYLLEIKLTDPALDLAIQAVNGQDPAYIILDGKKQLLTDDLRISARWK